MTVRFTRRAAGQLDRILDYIESHSPSGAERVLDRLQATLQMLADHPQAGMAVPGTPFRRAVVTPYPYLIFYRVTAEGVTVHRIRHAASDPSTMLR